MTAGISSWHYQAFCGYNKNIPDGQVLKGYDLWIMTM